MKIVFFEINDYEKEKVKKAFPDDELIFESCPLPEKIADNYRDADIISVFVCSDVTKKSIEQFNNLKLIITRSTGFDHIDIAEAKKRNIIVCYAPQYASKSVAEYTLALLLSVVRKIPQSYLRVLKQHSFTNQHLQGIEISGKTIGIIGTGNIGKEVIKFLRGFNMNIIAYDIHQDASFAQEYGFSYVDLKTLYKNADIISLHVPLNKHTKHMINVDVIKQLKKGAYIINTARGEIIETQALVYGLEHNIIAGCGLDVLEDECFIGKPCVLLPQENNEAEHTKILAANNYLINNPNVIITPHNAYNTKQAEQRLIETTINEIHAFKKGNPCNIIA